MRCYPNILLVPALLVLANISIAQEPYHPDIPDPDVLARLSDDVSGVIGPGNLRHVCIAVSRMANIELCARRVWGRLNGFTARCRKKNLISCPNCLELRSFEVCPGITVA